VAGGFEGEVVPEIRVVREFVDPAEPIAEAN
jgi:hypothetical protein